MTKTLPPVHPGEILREEFLIPLGISAGRLAKAINVPRTRIERLVKEEVSITPDTALRLGKALRTTPDLWLNLQTHYDLTVTKASVAKELAHVEELIAA